MKYPMADWDEKPARAPVVARMDEKQNEHLGDDQSKTDACTLS
jgi:hypothetical protein